MTTLYCPNCGEPADVQHQSGFGRIADLTLVTCWQPGCLMNSVTLTDTDYRDFARPVAERGRDLSDYGLTVARYDPDNGMALEAA